MLDTAVAIMGSDFASIQRFFPARGELQLLGFHGFSADAAQFWEWVRPGKSCSCGQAIKSGQRSIVPDRETCEWMAGSEDLEMYRQAGIRAVQSTPLVSRSGQIIGMISTHWREPHTPGESELRTFDVLARQAADLIERVSVTETLRQNERRFREMIDALPTAV